MAVVNNSQQDLEENQNGQSSGNGGSNAPISVAGATGGGGSSPSGQSGAAPAGTSGSTQNTSSGGFTNLKSYLNANSNYNGGQGLAGEVNSNLQNQSQNINNNINNASTDFQNQTVNSVNPVAQNYNNFESGTGNGTDLNSIQSYAQDANNVQNTQNLQNATYNGPNNLNDLTGANNGAAIQSQVNNYNGLVSNTNSEAGRVNLLQNLYGKQGYNQGQQTLDNAFLQGQNFAPAQAAGNQLGNAYNTASNNAIAQGQQAGQQIKQYANNVSGQLNNAEGTLYGGVNDTYQTNLAGQAAQVAAQQQALQNYNVGQGEAAGLGLTGGQNLYNAINSGNVGNYVTANNAYGVQDAASQQQLAQNQALQNLLGGHATSASQANISNLNAANTGGVINYNQQALQNAITGAGSDYTNQANPNLATLNSLGSQNYLNTGTGRINSTQGTYNQMTGVTGDLSQNFNNLLDSNNDYSYGNRATTNYLGNKDGSQTAAYYEALNNLANLQNQYGAFNKLNVSGE